MSGVLVDLDAERCVLGACVTYPGRLAEVECLSVADLAGPGHQAVLTALRELARRGESIGEIQVIAELTRTADLARVGGPAAVLALTDRIQSPTAPLPLDVVKALSRRRRVRAAALATIAACDSGDSDALAASLADAQVASQDGIARSAAVDAYDAYCEALLACETGDRRELVQLGWPLLASAVGDLPVPTSVGILATTNVGKSSYVLELLLRSIGRHHCGYLSVEDQLPRVSARIAGMVANVDSRAVLSRSLEPLQLASMRAGERAVRECVRGRLFLDCLPGGTDYSVLAAMTGLAAKGCKIIAVDYLQKISPSTSHRQSRAQEVSDIASKITSHGQRLGVITVLVSQTARNKERENKCPSKHDMKESGDVENMLDVIVALWREEERDGAPMQARAIKTKDGGLGKTWSLARRFGRLEEMGEVRDG